MAIKISTIEIRTTDGLKSIHRIKQVAHSIVKNEFNEPISVRETMLANYVLGLIAHIEAADREMFLINIKTKQLASIAKEVNDTFKS